MIMLIMIWSYASKYIKEGGRGGGDTSIGMVWVYRRAYIYTYIYIYIYTYIHISLYIHKRFRVYRY